MTDGTEDFSFAAELGDLTRTGSVLGAAGPISTFCDKVEEPIVTREDGATRTPGVAAATSEPPPMGAATEGGVTADVRVSVWLCGGVLFTEGEGVVRIGVITVARGVRGVKLVEVRGVITVGCRLVETDVLGRRAISTERFTGGE